MVNNPCPPYLMRIIANSNRSINVSYYVLLGTVLRTVHVITTHLMETDSQRG